MPRNTDNHSARCSPLCYESTTKSWQPVPQQKTAVSIRCSTIINHFMYTSLRYDAHKLLFPLLTGWGHYLVAILFLIPFLSTLSERYLNSVLNVGPGHPILRATLPGEHHWSLQTRDEKRAELWLGSGQQSLLLYSTWGREQSARLFHFQMCVGNETWSEKHRTVICIQNDRNEVIADDGGWGWSGGGGWGHGSQLQPVKKKATIWCRHIKCAFALIKVWTV